MLKTFDEVFDDYTKYGTKIKTEQYHTVGTNIIIDQGQADIAGYTDQIDGLFKDVPVIVFGDHTRIIKYINRPFFLGADGTKILKSKIPDANYKYLYYALKNAKIPNTGYNRHFKWLKQISISYPELQKQSMIVEILDKLEDSIDNYNTILGLLDKLVKARFIEMFGDPKDNQLCWKKYIFKDVCTVRQGLQISISKRLKLHEDNSYEYITIQSLHGAKEKEYIKNPSSNVLCTKDDILMTRTGNTGMVITDVEGVFHNNFFLIDFDRIKFNKIFLSEYLKLDYIQAEILRRAGTSTIPDLNHGEFYKIPIYEPPIELQQQFADFVRHVDKSREAVKKSLEKTKQLYDSLMQEYFG